MYKCKCKNITFARCKFALSVLRKTIKTFFLPLKPWNLNTSRSKMQEDPLLYAQLSLQVVYC